MKYLLKNGTLVSGAGTEQKDILIEGEKIVKIEGLLDVCLKK